MPIGILFFSALVLGLIGAFFVRFYPVFNFCWGDYTQEFQRKEGVRKFVLIVVILGLVVSFVGGILANLVKLTKCPCMILKGVHAAWA